MLTGFATIKILAAGTKTAYRKMASSDNPGSSV
jgi:hypothetical protein